MVRERRRGQFDDSPGTSTRSKRLLRKKRGNEFLYMTAIALVIGIISLTVFGLFGSIKNTRDYLLFLFREYFYRYF